MIGKATLNLLPKPQKLRKIDRTHKAKKFKVLRLAKSIELYGFFRSGSFGF